MFIEGDVYVAFAGIGTEILICNIIEFQIYLWKENADIEELMKDNSNKIHIYIEDIYLSGMCCFRLA